MLSHFKLLLSIIVAGMFMLIIRQVHNNLSKEGYEQVAETLTAEHVRHIANLIQFDLNRVGLGVKGEDAILEAKPNRFVFKSDINLDGHVETIRYYLSDTTAASSTQNPHDKILYRVVDSEPVIDVPLGVTKFDLKYYNSPNGQETSSLGEISTIAVELEVQSTFSMDDNFAVEAWQTRSSPPNLMIK